MEKFYFERPSMERKKLIKSSIINLQREYTTYFLSRFPKISVWWGIAAWPVDNFVKENNFTGKTVIPFCTSASSGLGNSGKLLEDLTKTGNWKDGHRFSSSATESEIKSFTDSIK